MPTEKFYRRSAIPRTFFILDKAISTEDDVFETLIEIAMSMITASLWVSRGVAARFPEKYDINEEELSRISKLAKLKLEDAKEDLRDAKNGHLGQNETEESEESEVRMHQSHAWVILLRTVFSMRSWSDLCTETQMTILENMTLNITIVTLRSEKENR